MCNEAIDEPQHGVLVRELVVHHTQGPPQIHERADACPLCSRSYESIPLRLRHCSSATCILGVHNLHRKLARPCPEKVQDVSESLQQGLILPEEMLRTLSHWRCAPHLCRAVQELHKQFADEGFAQEWPGEGAERGAEQQLLEVGPLCIALGGEGLLHPADHRAVEVLVALPKRRQELDGHLVDRKVEPNGLLHPRSKAPVALEDIDNDPAQNTWNEFPHAHGHSLLVHPLARTWQVESIVPPVEEQAELREDVLREDAGSVRFVEVETQTARAEPSLERGLGALPRDAGVSPLHVELEIDGVVLPIHVQHSTLGCREDTLLRVSVHTIVVGIDVKGGAHDHLYVAKLGVIAEVPSRSGVLLGVALALKGRIEEFLEVIENALHLPVVLGGLAHHMIHEPETRPVWDRQILEAIDGADGAIQAATVGTGEYISTLFPETEELLAEFKDLREVDLVAGELPSELRVILGLALQLLQDPLHLGFIGK
mmetsp:Transcript_12379/g.27449  ORF Transcript_12379/g.27449 Transcript_12379/m.27449 type:complete len:485 (-) Transcript_12379:935-2389(-)